MIVTVCMAVYNGEKYIGKQLQTIYEQTRPADEVVLCDDCSTDATPAIIERFIEEHHLAESWKLYKNQENKGYPQNFYYVMSLCKGEVVFLADQDDLWEKDKMETMLDKLEKNPHIELLASAWGIIDEKDRILMGHVNRGRTTDDSCSPVTIEEILYCNQWPGMCTCYRRSLGEAVLRKVKQKKIPHDIALGMVAAERQSFYSISQVKQYHRRHEANTAMEEHRVRKRLNKKRKLTEIRNYLEWLEQLQESDCLEQEINKETIRRKIEIMKKRLDNLEQGRRLQMIKQYLANRKEIRPATVVCDVVIAKSDRNG